MEKKTIEKMREAVLAYCETVCPNVGDRFDISECAKLLHVVHAGDWHQWQIHCPIFNGGGYTWMAVFKVSPYPSCTDFVDFYRLLGLSERDAVADEREEMMKTVDALSAMVSVDPVSFADLEKRLEIALRDLRKECDFSGKLTEENAELEKRNAALVAALEDMYLAYGTTVKIGQLNGLRTVQTNIGRDIKHALAANENGGVQG